ncbi:glycosyltransferase family 4 protein [Persicobacter diffluens]|uniref:Glycosyl transferase family 1 domain-containing protein n=1 Tax=Persicobacter diffluens TaxID=981 RepID=A0AAN4VWA3_9BACT|nr:hypothetical protein PEDI_18260 [Persicobacter diffluens]
MKVSEKLENRVYCHLFNDYSGSAVVLRDHLQREVQEGRSCMLITSNTNGVLSGLKGVRTLHFPYQPASNKLITLLRFFWAQLYMIYLLWQNRKYFEQIYINTLLPFGAALMGYFSQTPFIYHIHETSIRPEIFKQFLKWPLKGAQEVIFVSAYLARAEGQGLTNNRVIYNGLSEEFMQQSEAPRSSKKKGFVVLMLCSLKKYKGVDTFVNLAAFLPEYRFNLVLNASQAEVDEYFQNRPSNLFIYPAQKNIHPFYAEADLLLNLSDPEQWVETFGMTLLEGMAYGLPCICPNAGGPLEVVENGVQGICCDVTHMATLLTHIRKFARDKTYYRQLSAAAKVRANEFTSRKGMKAVG